MFYSPHLKNSAINAELLIKPRRKLKPDDLQALSDSVQSHKNTPNMKFYLFYFVC